MKKIQEILFLHLILAIKQVILCCNYILNLNKVIIVNSNN